MNEDYIRISLLADKVDHQEMKNIAEKEKEPGEVKPNYSKFYRQAARKFIEGRKEKSGTSIVEYALIIMVCCFAVYGFFQVLAYFAKLVLY